MSDFFKNMILSVFIINSVQWIDVIIFFVNYIGGRVEVQEVLLGFFSKNFLGRMKIDRVFNNNE